MCERDSDLFDEILVGEAIENEDESMSAGQDQSRGSSVLQYSSVGAGDGHRPVDVRTRAPSQISDR